MNSSNSRLLILRTRTASFAVAGVLLPVGSALVGLSPIAGMLIGILFALGILAVRSLIERLVLHQAGCRTPNRLESERLSVHPVLAAAPVMVHDSGRPWLVHCPDRIVLSVALLDVLEDRALLGFLAQASYPGYRAAVIGEAIVWSCIWPLALGRVLTSMASVGGRVLAMPVGFALILPMIVWRDGFVLWAGRALAPVVLGWIILMLAAGGYPGLAGAALLAAVMYPLLQAILRWEWRQVEKAADRATIDQGLGSHLLDAIETLTWVKPVPPRGILGLLFHTGTPARTRADRVRRYLSRNS